jgi:hypothetical protein
MRVAKISTPIQPHENEDNDQNFEIEKGYPNEDKRKRHRHAVRTDEMNKRPQVQITELPMMRRGVWNSPRIETNKILVVDL